MSETFDLGAYLGEPDASGARPQTDELVAYNPSDLTTHGVIVGMTGSGKTGLGMVLLEEALSSGIPTLILDPKGDMGNLLLTFPNLAPADFAPWVPQGDDPAAVATTWTEGLAKWNLGPANISDLRTKNRFAVFTPGSNAGIPLNIIGSLSSPSSSDIESTTDEVEALASGLLGLVGIESDPLSSPEHILITNLILSAWTAGEHMDLPTLLTRIADPPMRKLGVIDIDQFFPKADRTALMMKLNGLLASPAFAAWSQGVPMDIEKILWDEQGRPTAAVIYLAHLSDEERQMVVSLLLSKMVTWMRTQQGTPNLRALVYMDEVYGFVPPSAQPPAKKPLLTLFKQARAFGIGVVLATQNPVDIDYKAISNAGTWMIGRLQTERDKARLLEGLSSASGSVDLSTLDSTISGLGKRQFMMHTTGGKAPRLFGVRWAMSYLCGPLSKDQIIKLPGEADLAGTMKAQAAAAPSAPAPAGAAAGDPSIQMMTNASTAPVAAAAPVASAPSAALADDETPTPPEVAEGIPIRFVDPAAPWASQVGAVAGGRRLQAGIAARVQLVFDDEKSDLRTDQTYEMVLTPLGEIVDLSSAYAVDYDDRDLRNEQPAGTVFAIPDAPISSKTYFNKVQTELTSYLQREQRLQIPAHVELKLFGRPGEGADAFIARCKAAASEAADAEASKLRDKLLSKREQIETAIRKAEEQKAAAEQSASASKTDEFLGGAGSLLGALLGGRRSASSIASAVRGVASRRSKSSRAADKVETYQDRIDAKMGELHELETAISSAIVEIDERWSSIAESTTSVDIPLERNDISIQQVALIWVPMN